MLPVYLPISDDTTSALYPNPKVFDWILNFKKAEYKVKY